MMRINSTKRVLGYRGFQVLEFVRSAIDDQGRAPSYGMIRDQLGFSNTADVCNVVRRLERRGLLSRTGNRKVRRIRLTQTDDATAKR